MKKTILIIVAVVVLIGIYFISKRTPAPVSSTTQNTYKNDTYRISFKIPEGYVLNEAERGDAHRGHYAIVMVKKEDSVAPINGEGPTAITVDIFQNNLDKMSLSSWFHGTNESNGKLTATQSYASTTIAGKEAITYKWSGLYEGESTVFQHNGNIIMISVTHLSPEDKNITAGREVINSFTTN